MRNKKIFVMLENKDGSRNSEVAKVDRGHVMESVISKVTM